LNVATKLVCRYRTSVTLGAIVAAVAGRGGAMHVARNRRTYVARSGEQRVYESVLVRRTYRDGGKVKHETLANLSALPEGAVAAI
jgi:hypothetical protein